MSRTTTDGTASVHDVAAFILGEFDRPITTMKLQKLTYLAQGWSFVLLGRELFDDDFEAWANGPVNYNLFDLHRGQYTCDAWPAGRADDLLEEEVIAVEAMLDNYSGMSGLELSELTHQPGTPWDLTRKAANAGEGQRSRKVIDREVLAGHFRDTLAHKSDF